MMTRPSLRARSMAFRRDERGGRGGGAGMRDMGGGGGRGGGVVEGWASQKVMLQTITERVSPNVQRQTKPNQTKPQPQPQPHNTCTRRSRPSHEKLANRPDLNQKRPNMPVEASVMAWPSL